MLVDEHTVVDPRAGRCQLPFQRTIVVDLTVVDDDQAILLERLVRRLRQVDDRQPAMAETDVSTVALPFDDALGIRPAMCDGARR